MSMMSLAVDHAGAGLLVLDEHDQAHRVLLGSGRNLGIGGAPASADSRSQSARSLSAAGLLGRASSASEPISATAQTASPFQPRTTLAVAYRPGITVLSA